MLEKIGLPAKPSLRGNNWVVDATHCQSCSSQFTFINRKHHCRRCGGIFCNSCTQHRMVLRGQGDSPVRICEPCKKLEEAARFELRHGHRSRAAIGSSKYASRNADDVLNELLANNSKDSLHTGSGKEAASQDEDQVPPESTSDGVNSEIGSFSPEELRQQSLDERNKYKTLKAEGKKAEALKAFKRAKELERQAEALDLQLRKNRKKALASSSSVTETLKNEGSVKPTHQKAKKNDDLTAELRELGWSDVDINDAEKKPGPTSLEGELLNLIGHESRKTGESKVSYSVDKTQVNQMKKKALALKREGKLSEAKEELKRAKILEKQLEEQELLGDAEESDDELSALIRGLDDDKQKDFSAGLNLMDSTIDLDLSNYGGDFNLDGNFEVTDDDMHDPDIAAALCLLGWDEEPLAPPVNSEALTAEIHNLKREAVSQKQAGNMAEALSLVMKAKALEKDLHSLSHSDDKASELSSLNAGTFEPKIGRKPVGKSRIMIQRELLAVKKKALALRREGKLDEAEEELKKGKVLELQLEEIDNPPKTDSRNDASYELSEPETQQFELSSGFAQPDEEADVTDQDLNDPSYLSLLKNLGWQEEENKPTIPEVSLENKVSSSAALTAGKLRRSKAEIQRELLGLKRKALAFRRQGQETEAEEVLGAAKVLEEQLAEKDAPKREVLPDLSDHKTQVETQTEDLPEIDLPMDKGSSAQTPFKRPAESSHDSDKRQALDGTTTHEPLSEDSRKSPSSQQEILAHKRRALALKREGKLAEAREELRKAKLLEKSMEENKPKPNNDTNGSVAMDVVSSSEHYNSPSTSSKSQEERAPSYSPPKPMSSNERFKLQRECLTHKRNALKLRREGRTEEADAELEVAKKLEAQLEEVSPHEPATARTSTGAGPADDAGVEDFLDPQLLSALKAIGLQDAASAPPKIAEIVKPISNKNESEERVELEAQIKAEKMKALTLKRAGKQAEALDALRRAKQMEKKLNSPPPV